MTSFEPTPGVEVHALLRSTRLDLAQRILGTRMANVTYTEDAWTLITVRYPDVESVRQLLYLGDHIRCRMEVAGNDDFIVKVPNTHAHAALRVGEETPIGWVTEDCRALDAH